ncbi:uncharacterized protein LOC130636313 [Hydractinia symbiolongicarpus]|uniref:uncharacterized protein LOC130636313 n=1 Tax=Hydractinia symbiolongicarpus TaxID=13093 RepID=UPI00254A8EF9|nr:uncharacterized protein LOC130636313 [Hydractinia symbiolongicarpus]
MGVYLLVIVAVLVILIQRAKERNTSQPYAHIKQSKPIPCDYQLIKAQVPLLEQPQFQNHTRFFAEDFSVAEKKPRREKREVPKIVLDDLRSNNAKKKVSCELEANACKLRVEEDRYQQFCVEDVERKAFDGSSDSYASMFEEHDEITPPRSPKSPKSPMNFLKKQRSSLKKLRKKLSGNFSSDESQ